MGKKRIIKFVQFVKLTMMLRIITFSALCLYGWRWRRLLFGGLLTWQWKPSRAQSQASHTTCHILLEWIEKAHCTIIFFPILCVCVRAFALACVCIGMCVCSNVLRRCKMRCRLSLISSVRRVSNKRCKWCLSADSFEYHVKFYSIRLTATISTHIETTDNYRRGDSIVPGVGCI